jgi:UDP-hydrolysing UDP-N-acetyl-D-glucosamine 2-epimerase
MGQQMSEVLDALLEINKQTVIIYPNNDSGSDEIIEEIEKRTYVNTFRIFKNLPHLEYFSLLRYAKALVGNSSSGIIEAPSLRLPVINIGSRNVGRDHGENVIFVDANRDEIKKAIKKVLNDIKFKRKVANCSSPYGDGNASKRIVKVLREIEINGTLLRKQITY